MKSINKRHQSIFDSLVEGLAPGECRKLKAEGYMPLSIERLTDDRYSLTHYFEQNGDLVPDPDMSFWRGPDGKVYPVDITQGPVGRYAAAIEFGDDGNVSGCRIRLNSELVQFAHMWLKNIRFQFQLGEEQAAS